MCSRPQRASAACVSLCSVTSARARRGSYGWKNRPSQNKGKSVSAPPNPQGWNAIVSQGNAETVKETKSRVYITSLWEMVKVPFGRLHSQSQMLCASSLPRSPSSRPGLACRFSHLLLLPPSYRKGASPPSPHMGERGELDRKGYNCWLGGSWSGGYESFQKIQK